MFIVTLTEVLIIFHTVSLIFIYLISSFEVELFIFETIIVVKLSSQVIKFICIKYFRCKHINATIHTYTFSDNFYLNHYFTLCVL